VDWYLQNQKNLDEKSAGDDAEGGLSKRVQREEANQRVVILSGLVSSRDEDSTLSPHLDYEGRSRPLPIIVTERKMF